MTSWSVRLGRRGGIDLHSQHPLLKLAYPRNSQDTSSWTRIHAMLVTTRPHRGHFIVVILMYLGWDILVAHVRIDACWRAD